MKGLRFTVPLVRFVVSLDSLQSQPLVIQKPTSLPRQTLLRIFRIEKPLEALLPNPKPSVVVPPTRTRRIPPPLAPKKKINQTRKSSGARDRKGSSRQKKK